MIKVLPIKGLDSYWALQSYIKLLIGLKMLPMYMGKSLEEFFAMIEAMSGEDRKKIVREAILVVTLEREEINSLIKFATDANGVPFTQENTSKIKAPDFLEIINAVVQEIAAMEINFLTPNEKKN